MDTSYFLKQYTNSAVISANSFFYVPISDDDNYSYAPFHKIKIINKSIRTSITVYFDGIITRKITVPSNTALELNQFFSHAWIYNDSSDFEIVAGNVIVEVGK